MANNKVVELKDKATSFHDFETGFDIACDQRKSLGEKIGRATAQAIRAGRLIEVSMALQLRSQSG
ncbi:MAG TPA: hypothetical protein VGN95_21585, partial [Pyrinomonadaceae bacterium]|nr:hypothetical protein [Pyrinomonadaceae bacterium]